MKGYDPKKIEKKQQAMWDRKKLHQASDFSKKKKYYCLVEFPYPSGEGLHVGHIRSYTAIDILARKHRMEGFNVLFPMGWDAFGLPAENYAIKTKIHPAITTKKNIATYKKQMKSLGLSFDWSREINTTDPKYYKWTQWIFLQLLKHNLAYKARIPINWCPKDKIGLANEEVVDGKCERCGTAVEKKDKEQWMLAITKYADRLDKDLDSVDYLEKIKLQQKNWIGRSEGAEIDFLIKDFSESIKVFTTRPETIFGVTYLVLSPEHPWVTIVLDNRHTGVLNNRDEVKKYVDKAVKKTEIDRSSEGSEKTGVEIKGIKAINPATKEEIPVWVADYVLSGYGTGAVMAVSAHDKRDFVFATKYKLPVTVVIEPEFVDVGDDAPRPELPFVERENILCIVKHWKDEKYLRLIWKKYPWKNFVVGGLENSEDPMQAAIREIQEETGYSDVSFVKQIGGMIFNSYFAAHKKQNRRAHFRAFYFELQSDKRSEIDLEEQALFDVVWQTKDEINKTIQSDVFSGRYYWNLLFTNHNSPYTEAGILINSGKFTNQNSEKARKSITDFVGGKWATKYKLRDWVFSRQRYWGEPIPVIHCEKCGIVSVLEKDLPVKLPNVKNYEPSDTGESPLALISSWVNTKCPTCKGNAKRETDVMPNWAGSSWYFLRYSDPRNSKVFAGKNALKKWIPVDLYNGGMEHTTLHLLYSRFWNKFLFDQKLVPKSEPYKKRTSHGVILAEGGEKMSKSKGNVINPDDVVSKYGADTLRIYEMFIGPYDQPVSWSTDGIIGPYRFLEKVWRIAHTVSDKKKDVQNEKMEVLLNKTIKKVSQDIDTMSFNTAVSSLMIFANEAEKNGNVSHAHFAPFIKLLSPFAPHLADEIWTLLKNKNSIQEEAWPIADPKKLILESVIIAIQVNGKTRATIHTQTNTKEAEVKQAAYTLPEIQKWLLGKEIKKEVYVPNRIFNIVLS